MRTAYGTFLLRKDGGVAGVIATPTDTVWLGLDADDRVLAADKNGRLWRAKRPDDAFVAGGYIELGQIHGSTSWDSAAGFVVAAIGTKIRVSHDGGLTFAPPSAPLPAEIRRVLARPDGVSTVELKDARRSVWISRDGTSWQRSRYQPKCDLGRFGPWVYEGPPDVPEAVLGADGTTWVDFVEHEELRRLWQPSPCAAKMLPLHIDADEPAPPADWSFMLEWTYEARGVASDVRRTTTTLPEPRVSRDTVEHTGTPERCEGDPPAPPAESAECPKFGERQFWPYEREPPRMTRSGLWQTELSTPSAYGGLDPEAGRGTAPMAHCRDVVAPGHASEVQRRRSTRPNVTRLADKRCQGGRGSLGSCRRAARSGAPGARQSLHDR